MKKVLSFLLAFTLFSCEKEAKDKALLSGGTDNLLSLTCNSFTLTESFPECWFTDGPNTETACKTVYLSNTYTVCYGADGSIQSTTWGGGGNTTPPPPPKPNEPPPPPISEVQIDHAYLCGGYNWKKNRGCLLHFLERFGIYT